VARIRRLGDDRRRALCETGRRENADGLRHRGFPSATEAQVRIETDVLALVRSPEISGGAMNTHLNTVARMEFTATGRLWWIRLLTAAYSLMTVAMAYASG
jgi:hypothetical protein